MIKVQDLLSQLKKDGRRNDKRWAYGLSVRFRVDRGPFQRAQLDDVSEGGLRLTLPRYIPKGARVQILYHQPLCSRQHWVEGQVRWSREEATRYATGIEVEFQSDCDEKPYRNLVEQLSTAC
jgi:hypothetical protein